MRIGLFEQQMTRIIPSFAGFTEFTSSIPKLYWDVKSQEQRILAICKLLNKVICYADMLGENVDEIAHTMQEILDGKLDDMIIGYIAQWFDENEPEILQDIDNLQEGLLAANEDIETINGNITTINDDIDDISGDINTINLNISSLENAIDAINTRAFENVSDMADYEDAEIGDVYITSGFYNSGDLGSAIYKVIDNAIANGMDVIAIQNNLFAVMQATENVNIAQLGAIANSNVDCSSIVNYAVANYDVVIFNDGIYKFDSAIQVNKETKIVGNWHKTVIECYGSNCFEINSRYVTISGFIIYGNNNAYNIPNQHICFKLPISNNAHFIDIEKCWVFLFEKGASTYDTDAMWDCKFKFVRFSKCNYGFYFHSTSSFSNTFEQVYFDACYQRICDIDNDFGSTFINCNFGISTLNNSAFNLANCRLTFEGCNFELDEVTAGNMIKITGYQLTFIGCKFNSTRAVPGTVFILDLSTQTNFANATFINCGAIYQSGGNQIMNPNNDNLKRNQVTIIGGVSNLNVNLPSNSDVAGICYEQPYGAVTYHSTSANAATVRSQIIGMGNGITFVDADTSKLYGVVSGQMREITLA